MVSPSKKEFEMAVVDKYTIGALASAVSVLKEYKWYGEEMRKIGRGFHPVGLYGESVDGVIIDLVNTLKELAPEVLESDEIPEHVERFIAAL